MMNRDAILAAIVVVLGAAGTFFMLPHRHGTARPLREYGAGAVAASLSLLVFFSFWSPPGPFLPTVFFYVFSVAALIGGLLTITSRNPIYSALWFASVVLSTAGLFCLGWSSLPGGGDDHCVRRRHHCHVLVRHNVGSVRRQGPLRPGGAVSGPCDVYLLPAVMVADLCAPPASKSPPADPHVNEPSKLPPRTEWTLYRGRDIAEAYNLRNSTSYLSTCRSCGPLSSLVRNSNGADWKPNVAGLGELALYRSLWSQSDWRASCCSSRWWVPWRSPTRVAPSSLLRANPRFRPVLRTSVFLEHPMS